VTPSEIIRIVPPTDFSFSRNYIETVKCLREFKKAVFSRTSDGRPSPIFLDLSAIIHISLAGALVLGAEVHRWSDHRRSRLRASNISEWKPSVRNILDNLGFFDLLNVKIPSSVQMETLENEITVLPMISSTTLDAPLLLTCPPVVPRS
jgi:anti-anti-sigma regulatory factor